MSEYAHSYRLFPLWAVLVLTIPVGFGAWGVSAAGYVNTLAATPLFALFAYGLAIGYVNRANVRVTPDGLVASFDPLPCGAPPEWVPRDEIVRVYLRYVYVSAKSGSASYWAAGVERADGRWLDLSDPLLPPEAARETAQEIALALEWTEPIAILRGMLPVPDRRMLSPLLLWGGTLAVAFLWGIYVELTSRH